MRGMSILGAYILGDINLINRFIERPKGTPSRGYLLTANVDCIDPIMHTSRVVDLGPVSGFEKLSKSPFYCQLSPGERSYFMDKAYMQLADSISSDPLKEWEQVELDAALGKSDFAYQLHEPKRGTGRKEHLSNMTIYIRLKRFFEQHFTLPEIFYQPRHLKNIYSVMYKEKVAPHEAAKIAAFKHGGFARFKKKEIEEFNEALRLASEQGAF